MVKGAGKHPEKGKGPAPHARLPCGRLRGENVAPREIFSAEEVAALVFYVQRRLPRTIMAGGKIASGYGLRERRKRWEKVCRAMYQQSRVRRTYNQVTHRWTDILDRERDLLDLLRLEIPGLAPPMGKRTEEEVVAAAAVEGQDRPGEGSFAGPSGTSGGGASAEVVVLDEENTSGEEAVQVPDDTNVPVRVHTVVAGRVAPSKSKKASRKEQARMARQRRLDATVAEYRRLLALEEEDTQSTATSTATAASSSGPTRAASQRSAPAVRSRATKANRHRRAAKTAAAPHRSCKPHIMSQRSQVASEAAELKFNIEALLTYKVDQLRNGIKCTVFCNSFHAFYKLISVFVNYIDSLNV
ncbi:uncharacterized protein LOC144752437 [Lissotriton helveticus]